MLFFIWKNALCHAIVKAAFHIRISFQLFSLEKIKNMLNKVTLIGNLGADPESRTMPSGAEVVNFRIGTSQSYVDKTTSQRINKTEWHSIVVFNPHFAKVALQYLNKGSKVYVEGQLQTRKWQDKSGQTHYTTEIVLPQYKGELKILDSKKW
ncbi:single-strand DNA-binding protein [Bartonella chomelii]|uniref:Single-stranded DNA-binding protein n=1 Tax=Bartonella chomelii TaxID=236402 RepID=A0ABR6E4M5_9HYPH|nr:single-strand DNA-binding protein [Bartonella chomelii]